MLYFYTLAMNYQDYQKLRKHNSLKRTKYLRINLPKEVKDLYLENYKTVMKEIEGDTNR